MKRLIIILTVVILFNSCKKYLAEKPNQQWVVPQALSDATALLDNYTMFNGWFPFVGLQGDDDFYLLDTYWNTLSVINQENYRWGKEVYNKNEWSYLYQMVLTSNLALETVNKIVPDLQSIDEWKRVKGSANFYRGHAFFHVATYYAPAYDQEKAAANPGIPLRLSSDINERSVRANLEESWQQIIRDFKEAAALLPTQVSIKTRPTKQAAFGLLARCYLITGDYIQAEKYADSSLQLQSTLLNYNTHSVTSNTPFARFNNEVIFHSVTIGAAMLGVNNWRCDSTLYSSYHTNDLRKTLFFKSNGTGTYGFKGNYDGTTASSYFNGPAVDEMYLTRAECKVRRGAWQEGLSDLDMLLLNRYKTGTFTASVAGSQQEALALILTERRKELVMRSIRWVDLRRLNKEEAFKKTLYRNIAGVQFILPPGDNRYTHYMPLDVIALTGMQQNTR